MGGKKIRIRETNRVFKFASDMPPDPITGQPRYRSTKAIVRKEGGPKTRYLNMALQESKKDPKWQPIYRQWRLEYKLKHEAPPGKDPIVFTPQVDNNYIQGLSLKAASALAPRRRVKWPAADMRLLSAIFGKVPYFHLKASALRTSTQESVAEHLDSLVMEYLRSAPPQQSETSQEYERRLTRSVSRQFGEDLTYIINIMMESTDGQTQESLAENLQKARQTLTNRQQRVIELRYEGKDGRPLSLEEVGREFGVTRERARQVEEKALLRLNRKKVAYTLMECLVGAAQRVMDESGLAAVFVDRAELDEYLIRETPQRRRYVRSVA